MSRKVLQFQEPKSARALGQRRGAVRPPRVSAAGHEHALAVERADDSFHLQIVVARAFASATERRPARRLC